MAKAKKMRINFKGVDKEIRKGGKSTRVPEGDYAVKLVSVSLEESEKSGSNYLKWGVQIVKPEKYKGKTISTNTSLKPDALWNLRNLIHAVTGKNVAGKAIDFNPSNIIGKIVGASVVDGDEYKGRIKSEVQTFFPKADLEKTKSKKDEDEDEDEEDDDDEEEEEEDEDDDDEDLDDVEVDEL